MGNTTSSSGSASASTLQPFVVGEFIPPTDSTYLFPYYSTIPSDEIGAEIVVFIHPENVLFPYYKLIYDTLHKFDASIHEPTRDHLVVVDTTKPIVIRLGIIDSIRSDNLKRELNIYINEMVHSLLLPSVTRAKWFTTIKSEPNTLICLSCKNSWFLPFGLFGRSMYKHTRTQLENFIKHVSSFPIFSFTERPLDECVNTEILSKKHSEHSIDSWAFGKTPEQEKAHTWLMYKRKMILTHLPPDLLIIKKSAKKHKGVTGHVPLQIPIKFNKEVDKYCGVPPKPKKSRKEKDVSSKDVKLELDDDVKGDDDVEVKDETSSFLRYRKLTSEDDRWDDEDAETKPLID
jgi:hypothetical protein